MQTLCSKLSLYLAKNSETIRVLVSVTSWQNSFNINFILRIRYISFHNTIPHQQHPRTLLHHGWLFQRDRTGRFVLKDERYGGYNLTNPIFQEFWQPKSSIVSRFFDTTASDREWTRQWTLHGSGRTQIPSLLWILLRSYSSRYDCRLCWHFIGNPPHCHFF